MTKYKKLSCYLIIFLAVIFAVCPAFLSPKPSANLHASGEITDLTGTKWEFNDAENINTLDINEEYELSFNTNSESKYSLRIGRNEGKKTIWYDYATALYGASCMDEAYRTIEITGGTDATNSTLISWLQSHATQIVTPEPTPSTGVIANIFVSTAMVSLFALLIVFAVVKNKKHAL